jgi:hypothetical protein
VKNKKAFNFFDISSLFSRAAAASVCAFSYIFWKEKIRKYSFLYKYMFLKINHLFRSFLSSFFFLHEIFFPRKNIFLHPKNANPKKEKVKTRRKKQQAIDVREKEMCVMCTKHHVVFFYSATSIVDVSSAWPCFLLFFGFVHTHETWHRIFSEIMFTHPIESLSLSLPVLPSSFPFFGAWCVCVDVQIFQICPYICSLCSAGDLSSL